MRFFGALIVITTLSSSCTAETDVYPAKTEMLETAYPQAGTELTLQQGDLITWFDTSVKDAVVLGRVAFGKSRKLPIAFEGAILHAVTVQGRGKVHCGYSGPAGKPSSATVGKYACLEDEDGDGDFDNHFMRYSGVRRTPFMVDAVMRPDPLTTPVPYTLAKPEQHWSTRVELYLKNFGITDFGKGNIPYIQFSFKRRMSDGTTKDYDRAPWVGVSNPPRMDRFITEAGACIRITNSSSDFGERKIGTERLKLKVESPGSLLNSKCGPY